MAEEKDALQNLALELPELLIKYQMAMKVADKESEAAMDLFLAKNKAQYNKTQAMNKRADTLQASRDDIQELNTVFQTAYNNANTQKSLSQRKIVGIEEAIEKTENAIRGIAGDFKSLKGDERTGDGEKLSEEIGALFTGPKKIALDTEYEVLDGFKKAEFELSSRLKKTNLILTNLSSLEKHTRQVNSSLAGAPNLLQSDDFETYFDNVLVQVLDSNGQVIPDSEIPGNSTRFKDSDKLTDYYRQIFIQEFAPSEEQQMKQNQSNLILSNQRLATSRYSDKETDQMFVNMKLGLNSSLYEYTGSKAKGNLQRVGYNEESQAYLDAITYLKEQGFKDDEEASGALTNILNASSVNKGSTFIKNLMPSSSDNAADKKNKMIALEVYSKLGLGSSIMEMYGSYNETQSALIEPSIPSAIKSYSSPSATDPQVDELINNIFGI